MNHSNRLTSIKQFIREISVGAIATVIASLLLTVLPLTLGHIFPTISGFLSTKLEFTIGETLIGLGTLLFIGTIYYIQRSRSKKQSPKISREYFEAIWEFEPNTSEVSGPICKNCLLKMEPRWTNTDRYSRGNPIITHFECENCQATTSGLQYLGSVSEAQDRVFEHLQAENRRAERQRNS